MHKNPSLQMMKSILGKNKIIFILLVLVSIGSILTSLFPPMVLQRLIDQNILPMVWQGVTGLAIAYASFWILAGVCDFLKGMFLSMLGQKMIHSLRMAMMKKLERMQASYYTGNTAASITSRFVADVNKVSDLFTDGFVSMMIDFLKIVGVLLSISLFSTTLALVVVCLIPIIYLFTRAFQKRMLKAQKENLRQLGGVNSHIGETLRTFPMIQMFAVQPYMEEQYNQKLMQNYQTKAVVNRLDSFYSPLIALIQAIVVVAIACGCAGIGWKLPISVGMLAASLEYIANLMKPIQSLGDEFQSIQSGISGLQRINAFLLEKEEQPKDDSLTMDRVLPKGQAVIAYDHLHFAYESGSTIFQNVSFQIPSGDCVTITGKTGMGKTTLFNLTAGLLAPSSGRVCINEVESIRIPDKIKRKIFGYVEQNFTFIPGTVVDQITMKDPSITLDQVKNVCKQVGLSETIERLPQGYDTDVSSGSGFSWGQRQLLAIARALVSNPAILLLDEMSANMDAKTEQEVLAVLQRVSKGHTILAISHRTSSILSTSKVVPLNTLEG